MRDNLGERKDSKMERWCGGRSLVKKSNRRRERSENTGCLTREGVLDDGKKKVRGKPYELDLQELEQGTSK